MSSAPEMEPARLHAVEELFHAALEQEPHQLGDFLDKACAGDESLRRDVEALLASHQRAGNFIEVPVVTVDAGIFESDQEDPFIGQTIGRYQVLKTIGIGGMGVVYLARRADQQYEKVVAIKLIKRGMDSDSVLRHFRNERQILASFDHPNIARLLDGDTTEGGLPYFVMECVEGLPIDKYCDTHALSVTERLKLFRQVCAAVAYAHRHTVIHRDIKPSNILVSNDGVPKLLDFGIAKMLQPGDDPGSVATMIGLRLMTPEYASPEQVRGEPLTTATDVYSLGVVLYRLLTGRLPYRLPKRSAYDIARAITQTEPQKPSAVIELVVGGPTAEAAQGNNESAIRIIEGTPDRLQRRLRGDLDNIMLMALRKEPERRYHSVEQFSEDIRRHLETLPVIAHKDTLAYRTIRFVQRKRALTAAAALVLLSLLGGITASTWQMQRARAQEAVAKAEKARAERRFNDVRNLANSVLFDYHDAIKDLSGATAVRERLVKDGLAYLDSLAGEASGDPALQRELAAAYDRVGDVRGQAFSAASLGDMTGAMDSYLKALRIREALVAANPGDVQSRSDLASSYVKFGRQLMETSEAERSMEYLRNGFTIYLQLAAEQPSNSEIRSHLAATHNLLGLALEDQGDASGALENHSKALLLRQELAAAEPDNQTHRRNLSITRINLGRALALSGDTKGGLESNQKALTICAALLAENPGNADYRRLLANAYQQDGDYRAALHDAQGALLSFRKKLALDEQALADDPLNANSRGDLGYSYERVGNLLAELGNHSQALSYYRIALTMFEKGAADAPQVLHVRYHVILNRVSIGEMQAKLGRRVAALDEYSAAINLLDKIPEHTTNRPLSSTRAQVYTHLGQGYAAIATSENVPPAEHPEYWIAARNMYAQSLKIWRDMQKRGILTAEDSAKPEVVAREIAKCDAFLRR
jgi:eukaryotic-like serine/threonine-protein kinase